MKVVMKVDTIGGAGKGGGPKMTSGPGGSDAWTAVSECVVGGPGWGRSGPPVGVEAGGEGFLREELSLWVVRPPHMDSPSLQHSWTASA